MIRIWLWYQYHRFQAWRLNRIAARMSQSMRHAMSRDERSRASIDLLRVGARSNAHETYRDALKAKLES